MKKGISAIVASLLILTIAFANKKQQSLLVAKTKQRLNARKSTEKIAVKANRLQNANIQTVKLVLNLPMEKLVAKKDKKHKQVLMQNRLVAKENRLQNANTAKEKLVLNLPMGKLVAKQVNTKKNRKNNSSITTKKAAPKEQPFLFKGMRLTDFNLTNYFL
jgi:hypothetical protein